MQYLFVDESRVCLFMYSFVFKYFLKLITVGTATETIVLTERLVKVIKRSD